MGCCCLLLTPLIAQAPAVRVGIFEGRGDIGSVLHEGTATYDPVARTYTVTGSGANVWGTQDAFHFVWVKVSGDATLSAEIDFVGDGGEAHRKAMLMVRQSLDADSAYADAALHGDGLTSLQFRDTKGEATHEIQANAKMPRRIQLIKRGLEFSMFVAGPGEPFRPAGGMAKIALQDPFYVGIGVCAHNKDRVEKAVFRNLELTSVPPPAIHSTLETITVSSTDRRAVYVTPERIEAPNWTRDGNALIFNGGGRLHRIPVAGGQPVTIDTGSAIRNNNDHGISPDGTMLAISDQSHEDRRSRIHVVPIGGGSPRLVTENAPSYWHGWSPDGKTLVFCGQRNGEFDIYSISAEGGKETRLTDAPGLDDGPEYSPDGQYIYFNSVRTGRMQIWRMKPDGSAQEQMTFDDANNWFPHISPDGRSMVFLTYDKDVTGHPANKDVMLRWMNLADRNVRVLAKLFGGQGTINVPSWSPDSKRLAFVSYQMVPAPR